MYLKFADGKFMQCGPFPKMVVVSTVTLQELEAFDDRCGAGSRSQHEALRSQATGQNRRGSSYPNTPLDEIAFDRTKFPLSIKFIGTLASPRQQVTHSHFINFFSSHS